MKILIATLLVVLASASSGCKSKPDPQINRLKREALLIQNASLEAFLKNDLKMVIIPEEQTRLLTKLRSDLQRCRVIEAELNRIAPGPDVAEIEKITTNILSHIAKKEEWLASRQGQAGRPDGAGF